MWRMLSGKVRKLRKYRTTINNKHCLVKLRWLHRIGLVSAGEENIALSLVAKDEKQSIHGRTSRKRNVVMEPREMENLLKAYQRNNDLLPESSSWTIDRSPLGGRGMFATRDIHAGETIFTDAPLLIGPRCYSKCLPMCVVCYRNECPLFPCDHGCGLPVCSAGCENSTEHARTECRFLREWTPTCGSSWSKDLLLAVVPVRALALTEEQCKLLYALECNADLTPNYEIKLLKRNVTDLSGEKQLELMKRTCGVFNTNSFEVVVELDENRTVSLRGLYPLGALQNHSCVPNTRHHFDDRQRLHVSAALPIAADEELTMSYTDLLWDTCSRRRVLKATKHFTCKCGRCRDPTEFGSRLGALFCARKDCSGQLFPRNPLSDQSSWSCDECRINVNYRQIECIHSALNALVLGATYEAPRKVLKFATMELSKLVPPNNHITMAVKYCIISYFGRVPGLNWMDLTDVELRIKKTYCNDVLSSLDALGSGDSIKKGLVLYELYRTNLELSRRQASTDDSKQAKCDDNELLLRKAMSILQSDVGASHVRRSD